MRVLVTGGRDYADDEAVWMALGYVLERYGCMTLIQGGATGADALARGWSYTQSRVTLVNEPANWRKHGRSAGPIRNRLMLDKHKPDLVIAFPGGRGTAHMMRIAREAGVPVVQVHGLKPICKIEQGLRDAVEKARGAF